MANYTMLALYEPAWIRLSIVDFDFQSDICHFWPMKLRNSLIIFLLSVVAVLCGCGERDQKQEPTQIPIPEELAQEDASDVKPGHLELMVERSTLEVAERPFGIALSSNGKRIYVASAQKGKIVVIDAFDQDVIETWGPFGEYLFAVIPSTDDKTLFAYGLGGEHLFAINTETGRVTKKFSVGRNVSDAIPGPENTLLVGSAVDKVVTIIDQENLKVRNQINFSHSIGYITVGQTGQVGCATGGVYTIAKGKSTAKAGPVSFFNPLDGGQAQQAEELSIGAQPRKPIFVDNDKYLLVPDRIEGTVRVFDVRQKRLIKIVDVGNGPEKILFNHTRDEAYTIDTLGRSVTVLDCASFEPTRRIVLPANPEDGIVSPDGNFLYLTLPAISNINNRIAVIDLNQKILQDLIPAGKDPCRITLSPDGKTLFVTNFMGNTVSIVR